MSVKSTIVSQFEQVATDEDRNPFSAERGVAFPVILGDFVRL